MMDGTTMQLRSLSSTLILASVALALACSDEQTRNQDDGISSLGSLGSEGLDGSDDETAEAGTTGTSPISVLDILCRRFPRRSWSWRWLTMSDDRATGYRRRPSTRSAPKSRVAGCDPNGDSRGSSAQVCSR